MRAHFTCDVLRAGIKISSKLSLTRPERMIPPFRPPKKNLRKLIVDLAMNRAPISLSPALAHAGLSMLSLGHSILFILI